MDRFVLAEDFLCAIAGDAGKGFVGEQDVGFDVGDRDGEIGLVHRLAIDFRRQLGLLLNRG